MPRPFSNIFLAILSCVSILTVSCSGQSRQGLFQYEQWTVSPPVFQPGPKGTFDDVAVKDPTIVFYQGHYHMFYTSKATAETANTQLQYVSKGRSAVGYVSAPNLQSLNSAKRHDLCEIVEDVVVAPQVFYFEPHKLWYLIAQTVVEGKPDLMPIYLTNPDLSDVQGWSKPEIIKTRKSNNGFWIDFWVICDEAKAHLFFTDHEGSLFRMECPIDTFPNGYANEREETVLAERGENPQGRWRLHEGSHIYYVKKADKYLALLEAVYPHPTRKDYWDSRSRFMFAMVADKLEGPWRRVELGPNEFAGDPRNLFTEDGSRSIYDQVSHFELIRSGVNQRLEIEDFNLELLFQAFDASGMDGSYDYNDLPWELAVMRNY